MTAAEKNQLWREAADRLKLASHYAQSMKDPSHCTAISTTLMQLTISAGKSVRTYHDAVMGIDTRKKPK